MTLTEARFIPRNVALCTDRKDVMSAHEILKCFASTNPSVRRGTHIQLSRVLFFVLFSLFLNPIRSKISHTKGSSGWEIKNEEKLRLT